MTPRDAGVLIARLDAIPVHVPTLEQQLALADVLERRSLDDADRATLRQMFGLDPSPTRMRQRNRVLHGTERAVRWHEEHQVPDCRLCRYWRDGHTVHGTERSCQAHYADGTELCDACADFYVARHSRLKYPSGYSCGSAAGYRRHLRLGEPVCRGCRAAEVLSRALRQEKQVAEERRARAAQLQEATC